jgi:hypothetical protein
LPQSVQVGHIDTRMHAIATTALRCCTDPHLPRSLPHLLPPFADQFIELKTVFDWLETKRTNMKLATGAEAKLGHLPQEDYADAIILPICKFLEESWLAA